MIDRCVTNRCVTDRCVPDRCVTDRCVTDRYQVRLCDCWGDRHVQRGLVLQRQHGHHGQAAQEGKSPPPRTISLKVAMVELRWSISRMKTDVAALVAIVAVEIKRFTEKTEVAMVAIVDRDEAFYA